MMTRKLVVLGLERTLRERDDDEAGLADGSRGYVIEKRFMMMNEGDNKAI